MPPVIILNLKINTPLFATTANPLQLYHSPSEKMFALKSSFLYWFEDDILFGFCTITEYYATTLQTRPD